MNTRNMIISRIEDTILSQANVVETFSPEGWEGTAVIGGFTFSVFRCWVLDNMDTATITAGSVRIQVRSS